MQYVNDDMDELFRRAAENYPLDTNSANWNKVLAGLQDQNINSTVPEKKRNNGRFLWLLLLLPLGFVCNQLYSPGSQTETGFSKSGQVNENAVSKTHSTVQKNNNSQLDQHKEITDNLTPIADIHSNDQQVESANTYSSVNNPYKKSSVKNYHSSNTTPYSDELNAGTNTTNFNSQNEDMLFTRNYVSGIPYNILGESPSVVPARSLNPSINSTTEKAASNIQVAKRKKFYVGLMGGLDATTIKFQKVEDAGFNFGLLLGYQFNKKWSIESGAYLEKKYYYSDGKYFNTSKLYMPSNARIEDLSGNCKMIEVPVAAKYNFSTRKQSSWFGVVGLSSYFMLQENYTYNYYYGATGPVPHKKEYNEGSTHIFSNLSISGGYTHRLGNFADVRIEPYLKLPISGMGIGSLPFFSTGLQVGVTKKF